MQALLHEDAHEEGGLAFVNKELLDQQRGAIMELVKEVRARETRTLLPRSARYHC